MRLLVLNHVTARNGGESLLLRWCQLLDTQRHQLVVSLPSGCAARCVLPGDPAFLADAIIALLNALAQAHAIGAAGQQQVRRLVSLDSVVVLESALHHAHH